MNVNATLIIQAFHFFIAYQILKQLVLKPLLRIMDHDEKEQTRAIDALNQEELLYQKVADQKKDDWQTLKQTFHAQTPEIVIPTPQAEQPIEPTTFIPHDELHKRTLNLAKTITDRVKHDD